MKISRRKTSRHRLLWQSRPVHVARMAGVAVVALAAASFASAARADVSLVFGAYSSDKPSAMVAQVRPSLQAIAKIATKYYGEPVTFRLQIVRGYEKGVDLLAAGKFDIMRLGPASYVMVKERIPGIDILVMENQDGLKTFNGVIAVHKDSPLKDIQSLRGKSFAFGDEKSTLGRFFAQLTLMEAGILAKNLKHFEYLGRHDKVGTAVGAKLFDAGALESTTFKKLVRNGVPIRALATFANATRPWIARAGLDPKIVTALRKAMLEVADRKALRLLRFDGFLPGSDGDYDPTRRAIRENPGFFVGHVDPAVSKHSGR